MKGSKRTDKDQQSKIRFEHVGMGSIRIAPALLGGKHYEVSARVYDTGSGQLRDIEVIVESQKEAHDICLGRI